MDPCSIILFLVCLLGPNIFLKSGAQDFPGQQVVEGHDPLCCLVFLVSLMLGHSRIAEKPRWWDLHQLGILRFFFG